MFKNHSTCVSVLLLAAVFIFSSGSVLAGKPFALRMAKSRPLPEFQTESHSAPFRLHPPALRNVVGSKGNSEVLPGAGEAAPVSVNCTANYCAGPFPIANRGGVILHSKITLVEIWYGNWNSADVQLLDYFHRNLDQSNWWKNLQQFSDGSGPIMSGLSVVSYNSPYQIVSSLSGTDIVNIVTDAVTHTGGVNTNALYFVYSMVTTSGYCTSFCGWHTYTTINNQNVVYGYVPYGYINNCCCCGAGGGTNGPNGNSGYNSGGADSAASVSAHEIAEAITDPYLNAWGTSDGSENGDICAWIFGVDLPQQNGVNWNVNVGTKHYHIQLLPILSTQSCGGGDGETTPVPSNIQQVFTWGSSTQSTKVLLFNVGADGVISANGNENFGAVGVTNAASSGLFYLEPLSCSLSSSSCSVSSVSGTISTSQLFAIRMDYAQCSTPGYVNVYGGLSSSVAGNPLGIWCHSGAPAINEAFFFAPTSNANIYQIQALTTTANSVLCLSSNPLLTVQHCNSADTAQEWSLWGVTNTLHELPQTYQGSGVFPMAWTDVITGASLNPNGVFLYSLGASALVQSVTSANSVAFATLPTVAIGASAWTDAHSLFQVSAFTCTGTTNADTCSSASATASNALFEFVAYSGAGSCSGGSSRINIYGGIQNTTVNGEVTLWCSSAANPQTNEVFKVVQVNDQNVQLQDTRQASGGVTVCVAATSASATSMVLKACSASDTTQLFQFYGARA